MKSKTTSEGSRAATLTAERLRQVLEYNQETGEFRWKPRNLETYGAFSAPGRLRAATIARLVKAFNTRYAGQRAGCLHKASGYWLIRVDDRLYRAHRLAHLYMTGEWPPETIDHKYGARADNRWNRLRPASQAEQVRNLGLSRKNTSGVKGVSWDSVNNRRQVPQPGPVWG
jgi:hypothetical protein